MSPLRMLFTYIMLNVNGSTYNYGLVSAAMLRILVSLTLFQMFNYNDMRFNIKHTIFIFVNYYIQTCIFSISVTLLL